MVDAVSAFDLLPGIWRDRIVTIAVVTLPLLIAGFIAGGGCSPIPH